MQRVIYSLTGRGLYSELIHLVLARVYCDKNNLQLIVNTRNWNSSYKNGWKDYFLPTIDEINQFASSQVNFFGFSYKITLRSIFKHPVQEIKHIIACIFNFLYKKRTGDLLTDDIVKKMRSPEFIDSVGSLDDWKILFAEILARIYQHNQQLIQIIDDYKKKINIGDNDYIGVHIRRGDKVRSKEMDYIDVDQYVMAIKQCSPIIKKVYLATDDVSVVSVLRQQLGEEYSVFYNIFNDAEGFDETRFNKKSKRRRFNETTWAFFDVEMLAGSRVFIGTYSSNFSRIIPCFKRFQDCKSLDIEWHPVF